VHTIDNLYWELKADLVNEQAQVGVASARLIAHRGHALLATRLTNPRYTPAISQRQRCVRTFASLIGPSPGAAAPGLRQVDRPRRLQVGEEAGKVRRQEAVARREGLGQRIDVRLGQQLFRLGAACVSWPGLRSRLGSDSAYREAPYIMINQASDMLHSVVVIGAMDTRRSKHLLQHVSMHFALWPMHGDKQHEMTIHGHRQGMHGEGDSSAGYTTTDHCALAARGCLRHMYRWQHF